MRSAPRIQLRTIFFLIFCAAVALTVGTSPRDDNTALVGWYTAQLDWHSALLAFATVGIVTGLVQQAVLLVKDKQVDQDHDAYSFARTFAVAWRLVIAALLCICVITTALLARGFIDLPESEFYIGLTVFPSVLWVCCIIIVLSARIAQERSKSATRLSTRWGSYGVWIFGPLLAVLILPDVALIHNLVHIATRGIEVAQPGKLQRLGTFPDQRAAGFLLFWFSVGAAAALVLAGALLTIVNRKPAIRPGWRVFLILCYCLLVTIAAAYCIWYFKIEYWHLSPDLASVGLGASWVEIAFGGLVAALFATVAACRLAISPIPETERLQVTMSGSDPASLINLTALLAAVTVYFVETIRQSLSIRPLIAAAGFGTTSAALDLIGGTLRDPCGLLMIAISVLTLQLLWFRRRCRTERLDWTIAPLDRNRFLWNWAALLLLAAVGIPTISSFCFVYWLGPWYLYGPK